MREELGQRNKQKTGYKCVGFLSDLEVNGKPLEVLGKS